MTDKTALILVDIQNDYFTGGLWPVDDMQRVADTARDILNEARAQGQMIAHIRHEAASDAAPFFRPGTAGAEIHPGVAPLDGELVILKHRPNSFQGTDLQAHLQAAGITHVTIIGAMTQMCIDATARAARDFGYEVTLVADACGAKAQSFGAVSLSAEQVQAAFLGPLAMSYGKVI
ncbi:MAG: nicotinamidase-related amidase [Sulfitobacter sp.]|jgi:nicotinamidase-related amidase